MSWDCNSVHQIKVAGNSIQYFPRLRFWWVIITTLYQLILTLSAEIFETLQKVTCYHVDYNIITITKWRSITTANNNSLMVSCYWQVWRTMQNEPDSIWWYQKETTSFVNTHPSERSEKLTILSCSEPLPLLSSSTTELHKNNVTHKTHNWPF